MTDFLINFGADRIIIFDQSGKVQLACYIRGPMTDERQARIVQLAGQLFAECVDGDVGLLQEITFGEGKPS